MKRTTLNLLSATAVIILLILPDKIHAIPAFARKYQISCQVCHSPAFPKLKSFGDDFASNGYRMTQYESPRYYIPTGDDRLSLFRELPLAIRMEGFASYNFDNMGSSDFSAPFVIKILSAGELSNKLSYYFYFLFTEAGVIEGVEDAFLQYHDLFGTGMNFYIGQFQVADPLFKEELRYTLEPYRIYAAAPGNSTASLKYDRGIMVDRTFKTGTTIAGEIVNGSGLGAASEELLFDKDKYKDFMGRIYQKLGKEASVGLFGYTGKEKLTDPILLSADIVNKVNMFGSDFTLNFSDRFILDVQYVRRTDSKVFMDDGSTMNKINTNGGFAEMIFSPKGDKSNWYLTGLLNIVESDADMLDYRAATFHAGYLLRRNVRIVSEYTYKFSGASYGKISAGFVSAF